MLAGRFDRGELVRVRGRVERFRDELQVEVHEIARAEAADPAEFLPVAYRNLDELDGFLEHLAREVHDPAYAGLLERLLGDDALRARVAARAVHAQRPPRVSRRPARAHGGGGHAGGRGLHAAPASELRPPDLTAALVHDLGKTREFTYGAEIGLSEEGRLLGHLVLGQRLLDERAAGSTRSGGWRSPTASSATTARRPRRAAASARRRPWPCTGSMRWTRV